MIQTPSIVYESVRRTLAVAGGPKITRFPLPQNCPIQFSAYAFDQSFEMLADNFPPAPKNTASNATSGGSPVFAGLLDGNAILTKLSTPSPTGGGRVRFTASFARVPASYDDFTTQGVTFPGWINTSLSGQARTARTRNVNVRLHYDYFVVDPTGIISGVLDSGGAAVTTVGSIGAIPMKLRNVWLNTLSGTPQENSEVNDLVLAGGVTVGTLTYIPTYPTTDQYKVWITNAATALASHPWNETYPAKWDGLLSSSNIASAGQYQVGDSTVKVYEGNIMERMTPYVIPQ